MAEIAKLSVKDLSDGMIVVRFDKTGVVYSHYGLPMSDAAFTKGELIRQGVDYAYVRIDALAAADATVKKYTSVPSVVDEFYLKDAVFRKPDEHDLPMLKDIVGMANMHKTTETITNKLLTDTKFGGLVDTKTTGGLVSDVLANCLESPVAFTSVARMKNKDSYTYSHSINVAILALSVGRRLQMSKRELYELAFAALMHDVGKMKIPEAVLNKKAVLNGDEKAYIKRHPEFGYDMLSRDRTVGVDTLMGVYSHHERADGSGYPGGLLDAHTHKCAKIISLADTYDAMTSDTPYHVAIPPTTAIAKIFKMAGKQFNEKLTEIFISTVGLYPASALVILNTNELAIVVEVQDDIRRPVLLVISDAKHNPTPPTLLDLAKPAAMGRQIVSTVNPLPLGIDPNAIIDWYSTKSVE